MQIQLGSKVKDRVTGFSGIATARIEYITGCVQYAVTPDSLQDGLPIDNQWFDECRLDVQRGKIVTMAPTDNGGPSTFGSMPRS
jgi:hypothetical protein